MAGTTGLEPATSDVTGRRSNQLNYVPLGVEYVGHQQDNTGSELGDTGDSGLAVDLFRLLQICQINPRQQ